MTTAGSAKRASAASLLATVILLNGCVQRTIIFPEQDQSASQLAKDQAECVAEAKESTGHADAVGKGLRTTLVGSVAGAIAGAGVGALLGLGIAAGASTDDPGTLGLIIAGGAGLGAVIGWFVGTGFGIRASARQAQDLVDQAFQRCMEQRGYKVGREHL